MAKMIAWAESFCPFDAIGMPAHHIGFIPPSQDDFKHAVEKAKFVLYAARIKPSEAPALPFNENHITLAVKYFTQGDSLDANLVSQEPALNELAWSYAFFSIIVEKGNNTYMRTWTPEKLRLEDVVPAAPIVVRLKQIRAPMSPPCTSIKTSLANPALRLGTDGETTPAEGTGSGNKRKRSASFESDLSFGRSSTRAGASVLRATAATLPRVVPPASSPVAPPAARHPAAATARAASSSRVTRTSNNSNNNNNNRGPGPVAPAGGRVVVRGARAQVPCVRCLRAMLREDGETPCFLQGGERAGRAVRCYHCAVLQHSCLALSTSTAAYLGLQANIGVALPPGYIEWYRAAAQAAFTAESRVLADKERAPWAAVSARYPVHQHSDSSS